MIAPFRGTPGMILAYELTLRPCCSKAKCVGGRNPAGGAGPPPRPSVYFRTARRLPGETVTWMLALSTEPQLLVTRTQKFVLDRTGPTTTDAVVPTGRDVSPTGPSNHE